MTSERQKQNWRNYYDRERENINARRRQRYAEKKPKRDYSKDTRRVQKQKTTPSGWLRYALTHAKHRAKTKGLDFDVAVDDVDLPELCPVFGTPLVYGQRRKRGELYASPNSPSLDRHDNSRGYVRGNVRVISARANALKSDASLEELKDIVRYMEKTDEQQGSDTR